MLASLGMGFVILRKQPRFVCIGNPDKERKDVVEVALALLFSRQSS